MTRWLVKFLLPLSVLLGGGALLADWLIERADQETRADLVQQALLLAQAVNPDHIKALTGTEADAAKPQFRRLKEQLFTARQGYPQWRFIYIVGRKPDGSIVPFLDSDPAEAKAISPGAVERFRAVFDSKMPATAGPLSDHRGVWVKALAPITDPQSGASLAVLGVDVDASAWKWMLARAALPAVILTLVLVVILLAGTILLHWRSRVAGQPSGWMRHTELGLVIAIGLTLSAAVAWLVYSNVSRHRNETFDRLAASQTQALVERLTNVRDSQLESLALFCAVREPLTSAEFHSFATTLTRNPAVATWGWIPAVPAAEKARFEAAVRAAGQPDYQIWQLDEQGKRVPAAGRDVFYPVLAAAPLVGNERLSGHDPSSEPVRRATLEDASHTGLATGTETVTLVQETGSQKGMVIYQPVFARDDPKRLRGFVGAALRMETLLKSSVMDATSLVELSLLSKDAAPERLAKTWNAVPPANERFATRLIFAFGKVFAVTVHAGPAFGWESPLRAGGLALMVGLVLTSATATITRLVVRRREKLERLVAERTNALQGSEQSYRQLNAELEQRVTLRTAELAARNREIEKLLKREHQLSEMKSQFITVASHEFRTPLAAAVGSVELLERHAGRMTEAKRGELLTRIQHALERLTSIMDDMRMLSQADSSQMKVTRMEVDLPRFVADVMQKAEAKDRGQHRFSFHQAGGPGVVPTDTSLLHHILSNLLENAAKFSPAGTGIAVTLEIGAQAFTLTITDEGMGIPESDRERIFEPFVRGSNIGQVGGTGLGLNIVKRYTDLLGGRIELRPAARGTTFCVNIPLPQPSS